MTILAWELGGDFAEVVYTPQFVTAQLKSQVGHTHPVFPVDMVKSHPTTALNIGKSSVHRWKQLRLSQESSRRNNMENGLSA